MLSWSISSASIAVSGCPKRLAIGVLRSSSSRSVSLNPGVRFFGATSVEADEPWAETPPAKP